MDGRVLRQSKGFDIKLGDICDECNSGWMNDLEEAFRSLALPSILGDRRHTLRLDEEGQRLVATWGVKTWMLAERALQHDRGTAVRSEDALRYLHTRHMPSPAIQVLIGVTPPPRDSLVSIWTLAVPRPPDKPASAVAFLAIGELLFCFFAPLVVGDVPGEGRLHLGSDLSLALAQIWPHQVAEVVWPTPLVLSAGELSEILGDTHYTSLVHPLDESRMSVEFARGVAAELIEEAKSYLAKPAFRFHFQTEADGSKALLATALHPAPDHLSTLFAESVRNLVDALDGLARQLLVLSGGSGRGAVWPICETEGDWVDCDLGNLDGALRSRVERWQHYRDRKELRWLVHLWRLNDASRRIRPPRVAARPQPEALRPDLFDVEPGPGLDDLFKGPLVAHLRSKVPVGPFPANPTIPVCLFFGDDPWKGTPWDLPRAADDVSTILDSFSDVFPANP